MTFSARIRTRRARNRAQRDFQRAVSGASTPALRDELLLLSQHQRGVR